MGKNMKLVNQAKRKARRMNAHLCRLRALMAFGLFVGVSQPAHSNDLSDLTGQLEEQVSGLGGLLVILFAIVGVALVGIGLVKLFTGKNNPQASKGEAALYIIGGGLLLVMIAVANLVTETTFGTGPSQLDAIGIE